MRVLIAPDSFTGTLSAVEAADAVAAGWRRRAPGDELVLAPLSDGGPGFVDVLAASLGGERVAVTVADPLGRPVPATVLVVGDTAYVESAQACGLHLLAAEERDPLRTSTRGVGELLRAALDARRVVVGLGGSGTNDGGAGALAALGAVLAGVTEPGGAGLRQVTGVDGTGLDHRLGDVELVLATDVDNPLLGIAGASAVYGPQKGATREAVAVLDAALAQWARVLERDLAAPGVADRPGAGAAGGLGAGLMALGAIRVPGIGTVLDATRLADRVAEADLVVTGEGAFDWQSLRGKVVSGVAAAAAQEAVPCIVLAGRVDVGRREMAAAGVEAAYAAGLGPGTPAERLADLAERVAATWSRN